MKYEASPELSNLINQFKKKLSKNLFYLLFIFIIFSALIFTTGKLDLSFYVTELILSLSLTLIAYSQVVQKEKIIFNTAVEISMLNNEILLKTAPFNFFQGNNKTERELNLKVNEVYVAEVDYPIKDIFDLENRTLLISNNKIKVYLIKDFFDVELDRKLKELKINSRITDK